jgi:hypothetical protein
MPMGGLWSRFFKEVRPDLVDSSGKVDDERAQKFISEINLKRCRDRRGKEVKFCKHKAKVLDFIGQHSMPMLLALIDKKTDNADVLKYIRGYKWKRQVVTPRAYQKRPKGGVKLKITVRERDKTTDWSTVK